MRYIREFVICNKCGSDSNLNSVDFINGKSIYECINCFEKFILFNKDIYIEKKLVNFFYLKETGVISYECGSCNKRICDNIYNKSEILKSEILKSAYDGICGNCKEDNETTCLYCNRKIDFEHKKFYTDKKSFEVFCGRECYLKHIECEYY